MSMKRWLGLDSSVKLRRVLRSRESIAKRRLLLETLESREVFAAFVAGNLLVERVGNGTTLGSAAFPVAVQEYLSTGGAAVQTLEFTGTNLVTDSGSATSNGYLNTYNGVLAVPGYNSAAGTASVGGLNTKVGTVVSVDSSIASRTLFPTGGATGTPPSPFSGNNFRSMIATGSNTFYASGTASGTPSTGGVWYFDGTSFTQLNTTATNTRNLEIYNNQLYVSTASGTPGILAMGSGLPTSSNQTATSLISMGSGASPYGFVLFDTDSNGAVDLAYIADDRTSAGGGLQKWMLSAGAWSQSWALLVNASNTLSSTAGAGYAGMRGLTGKYENGVATLYATSASESSNNRLLSIVDSGSTPTSATTVALAGANYVFRGVDFSPVSPDVVPPTLTSLSPADGATGVAIGTNLVATFNETIAKGTGDILIKRSSDNSTAFTLDVTGSAVSVSGATVTIDPPSDLENGISYYVEIPSTAIRDVAGNFFSGVSDTTTWDFETVSLGDTTPPTVTSLSPADNATDVAISTNWVIAFNEEIVKGTGNILVKRTLDDSVVQTIDVTSGLVTVTGSQVTINPASDLANSVGYYIEIPATAFSDTSNNFYAGISNKDTWNFTTVADTTPPTVISIDDGDADNVVLTNVPLTYTIVFSEDIDAATVTVDDFDNAGTSSVVFGPISETSAGVFTVQVTATTAGTLVLRIKEGSEVRDVAGNLLAVPVVDNDTLTVNEPDVTPPTVVSIADDRSGAAINANFSILYTITFSEDVLLSTVNATDFDNAGTASISIGVILEPSPGVVTVLVTPTSAGSLQLRIPEGATILDLANNALVPPVLDDTTLTVNPVTTLTAGDIAFTGIQTDDPDTFSFVLLKDVVDGTQIRFTDNRWSNSGTLASNENTLSLVFANNGTGWAAGTHFVNTNGGTAPAFRVVGTQTAAGLVTGAISGLSATGDSLLAYQGVTAPTDGNSAAWIAGVNTRSWSTGATSNESELPTALTLGVNAIALSRTATDVDNGAFIAPSFVGSVDEIRSVLNEVSNWTTSNTLGPISPTSFNIVNVSSELFLSEVVFDPMPEVDTGEEYFELRGQPNAYLPGTAYLLLIEGDSEDGPGGIDHLFYLGGMQFGANGFLVLRQFGSTYTTDSQATVVTATSQGWGAAWSSRSTDIENGSVTAIVVLSVAAPVVDSDVDSNNDGELDGAALNWVIRDRIGNIDGGAADTAYGVLNTSGNGNGLVPAGSTLINLGGYHPDYMARNGLSTGYALLNNASTDWVVGELEGQMPTVSLATGGFSRPSAFGGSPLDDIGAVNSFTTGNAAPTDITLSGTAIPENAGVNAQVGTLSTSDPDSGDTFTYTLVAGTGDADNGAFNIDGNRLRATNSFDFESKSSYQIRLRTTDQGGLFAEKAFTISVTDLNELPTITSNGGGDTASISIEENTTAVTTVTATDPDAGSNLAYSISGGADAGVFQINSSSGVLTFIAAPDFEVPTDVNADNFYEVIVQVSDGALIDTQLISVTVTDVEESKNNPPTITSNGGDDTASVSVFENSTAVTTVTAEDPDAGQTLTFSISGVDASLFTIGSANGVLVFSSAPNFEAPSDNDGDNIYLVTVAVSDGFGGADTQLLSVVVKDVNEAPTITSDGGGARASVSVPENTTAVTTVTAIDPDAGASLSYSISGGVDAAFFAIDSSTGLLVFITAPNFENRLDADANNVYEVTVQVSDGSNVDTQAIEVTVTNVNEPPLPLINRTVVVQAGQTVQLGAALLAFSDPESAVLTYSVTSAPTGSLKKNNVAITTFTSTELAANSSIGNAIRYTAPASGQGDSFIFNVSDGTNTVSGVVVNILIVEATAPASFSGSYSQAFDNLLPSPIPADRLTLPVAQVLPVGWLVAEAGSNAEHSIQIDNGASTTGDSFLFGATLSNERALGSFSSGSLTSQYGVALLNTSGSTVTSLSISYTGEQWKNGVSATAVLNKLTFAYSTTATTINANTGYTQVPGLDFTAPKGGTVGGDVNLDGNLTENQQNISGAINGLNWAPGSTLYLRWTDINDTGNDDALGIDNLVITATNYAPTITSDGGGDSASLDVTENSTAVTIVTASDPDSGQTLTYKLSGTDSDKFIVSASGKLSFTTSPDYEAPNDANSDNVYMVTVTVDDGNGGSDSQSLSVKVINTNEVPTDIQLTVIDLEENAGANAFVGALSTVDPDAGNTFTYSLVAGSGDGDNGAFNIDGNNLRANASFDFETKSSYTVRVRSTDQGGLFTEKAFTISVLNVNETPVDIALSSTSIPENAGVNAVVGALSTVDPDAGNTFTYSLVAGSGDGDNSAFNIDGNNLRANASFDFETKSSYTVRVRSTDQGGFFTEKEFTISVTDVPEGVLVNGTSGPDTILVTYLGDGTTHTWSVKVNAAAATNVSGNLIVDGLAGNDTLQVIGRASNDVYVLEATRLFLNGAIVQFSRIETLRAVAGLGNDTLRVVAPVVTGVAATYDGGGGVDILETVSGANTWNVTGAGVGTLNGAFPFLGVESLQGGTGDDQFVFGATGTLRGGVLGGDGSDTISFAAKTTAQSVNLQLSTASSTGGFGSIESFIGGSSATLFDTLIGTNTSTGWRIHGPNTGTLFSEPTGAVNFSGFESVTGGTAEDVFEISSGGSLTGVLTGGTATGVTDRMTLSNKPGALEFRLDASSNKIPGVINGNYIGVEIISGNDVVGSRVRRVNNIATAWSVNSAGEILVGGVLYTNVGEIAGNPGTLADTLTGPSVNSTWTVNAAGGGSLDISGAKVSFTGIENLTGGTAVDSFVFTDSGSVSGVINGGTATGVIDQMDLSAKTTVLDFRLSATTNVVPGSIGGSYTGFERILGNGVAGTKITRVNNVATNWVVNTLGQIVVSNITYSGVGAIAGNTLALADTLSGPAVDSTWTITGVKSGTLAIPGSMISFASIENLKGNTARDHFEILPGGTLSGAVDGGVGTGINSLSYAQWSTGVTVNLAVTTVANATAIAGLTRNIQMVSGGSGNDTLTGQASKSTILVGLGGSDRLVGGSQRDILLGGLGTDTLLGGNGDDLMISGTTTYDLNREGLFKIYAEWISARTFAQRTANIWGNGTGTRANENYFFNSDPSDGITDTVFADSDVDSLTGGLNQDWFFASLNDLDDFTGSGATPDRRDR